MGTRLPQVPPMFQSRLKEPPVMCYGWEGAIWGLLESISGSLWWAGWQRLGVVPAGPREALTQHECTGCTPCPLLMNQLSHSTEKLTQSHRQKVTGRRTPGPRLLGIVILTQPWGSSSSLSPRNTSAHTQDFRGLPFACLALSALCWPHLFFLD